MGSNLVSNISVEDKVVVEIYSHYDVTFSKLSNQCCFQSLVVLSNG